MCVRRHLYYAPCERFHNGNESIPDVAFLPSLDWLREFYTTGPFNITDLNTSQGILWMLPFDIVGWKGKRGPFKWPLY